MKKKTLALMVFPLKYRKKGTDYALSLNISTFYVQYLAMAIASVTVME